MSRPVKDVRQIFVIMPFTKTPTRNAEQLDSFFDNEIRAPLEAADLKYKYLVQKSGDSFNINEKIIKDLYYADMVICDLSGNEANPNVMYELGIRLALSNKPVLLIREKHGKNKIIFDIGSFYTHEYDPYQYAEVRKYLVEAISDLENEKKEYKSPVLTILEKEIPLLQTLSVQRAAQLITTMRSALKMMTWLFVKKLVRFLRGQGVEVPENIPNLGVLLKYIETNSDKVARVNWAGFHISFGTQPAIDYFLSSQYLNRLVDPKVEEMFTGYVITYHLYFLSTDYYQGEWFVGNIHRFVGETNIFLQSSKLLRYLLLTEKEEERKKLALAIREVIGSSHIYSFEATEDVDKSQVNVS